MKRKLSLMMILVLMLTMVFGTSTVSAASSKMTAREKSIVKAYARTIEEQDLKYLNKYKYPGMRYTLTENAGYDVKILNAKYSKGYDSKVKLQCLYVKGLLVVTNDGEMQLADIKMGINIKKSGKTTYAYTENSTSSEVLETSLDEISDTQLVSLEKYLSDTYGEEEARNILYGSDDVEEDDSDTEDDSDYEEDSDTGSEDTSDVVSDGTGTIASPIAMNTAYEWKYTDDYLGDTLSGKYSLTIKNVKTVSFDDVEKMGFKKPTDTSIEYKLVAVKWQVKDVTLKKGTGSGDIYKSLILPDFWGTDTPDGSRIIGMTDYGFDGSLRRNMQNELGSVKLKAGETCSFSVEGNILVPTMKGETNYFIIRNEMIEDYDLSKIHFALK